MPDLNPLERALRRVDRFQQSHRPVAFVVAVGKKFGDDRAGVFAALMAFNAFLAVFPLLLLLTTLLGFLVDNDSDLQRTIVNSALRDFPIIGDQLRTSVGSLRGSGLALVVGVVGLLWGARGLSDAAQLAMAEVWNVPATSRPGFFPRLVRSLGFVGALGAGVAFTTAVTAGAALVPGGVAPRVLAVVGTVVANIGLFLILYVVLTPEVEWRCHVPGAVIGGLGWSLLQAVGALLVGHQLRDASQLYGYFGSVIGLLSWLYLASQLTLYAAEVNVVRARHMWPRSLTSPPSVPDSPTRIDRAA